MRPLMRRAGLTTMLAALPLLALTTAGCHTFKYFDIHVTFDPATFDNTSAFRVQKCRVTVTGADSTTFEIPDHRPPGAAGPSMAVFCPNRSNTGDSLDAGTFEYSSFAESGMLKFTVDVFEGLGEKPECQLGTGSVSVNVTGETTTKADLMIAKTSNGCPSGAGATTPDGGGGG